MLETKKWILYRVQQYRFELINVRCNKEDSLLIEPQDVLYTINL